jgi:hypothetical protein
VASIFAKLGLNSRKDDQTRRDVSAILWFEFHRQPTRGNGDGFMGHDHAWFIAQPRRQEREEAARAKAGTASIKRHALRVERI